MTGQDMKWRAEQSGRIERELIRRATPDLRDHCGGDCGDCNGCGPGSLCASCTRASVSCPVYPQETQRCVEYRRARA